MLFFVVKLMEGMDMVNDERQMLRNKILGARDLLSASEKQLRHTKFLEFAGNETLVHPVYLC